ncbi:MAG: UbiA family prenyltransferase [Armatimonadota bacterium]
MSVIIGVTAVCGLHRSGHSVDVYLGSLLFASQFLIVSGSFALNDILDRKRDISVKYKPLATGNLTIKEAIYATVLLIMAGLIASAFLGVYAILITAVQVCVVTFYSRLKQISGAIANLITALLCGSGFLLGATVGSNIGSSWAPALLASGFIMAREIVKDIFDMKQDRDACVPTIPLVYGLKTATIIVLCVMIITITTSMLPIVRSSFGPGYLYVMGFIDVVMVMLAGLMVFRANREYASIYLVVTAATFPLALVGYFL